jgi:hypothetical protein
MKGEFTERNEEARCTEGNKKLKRGGEKTPTTSPTILPQRAGEFIRAQGGKIWR